MSNGKEKQFHLVCLPEGSSQCTDDNWEEIIKIMKTYSGPDLSRGFYRARGSQGWKPGDRVLPAVNFMNIQSFKSRLTDPDIYKLICKR